jgi:serine/threonine protein kinase
MVSSELGSCEWFVWDLRRSGLIDRGHLDQVVGEFLKQNPRAEPPALADHLVHQKVLTPFQAERILSGKSQGLVLGPYILADAIGAGSMGQVYKAQSKTDNNWYAVKVLPRRSMWNVRLARRQVRSFTQFTHPAVVPFVDVGTAGGLHYLAWPLVEGETLEAKVQREGPLSPDVAVTLMTQVAQGLAAAHSQGLFHGLLKPSNILIGSEGQARILDFGIGSLLAENEGESLVDTMSTANTLTSGLDCASPESIMEPTNRTLAGDQYSFGCVLYYCLTGQYPFGDGTAVEKMMAHQFKQPTPLRQLAKHVSEGLAGVVERLMQKSPEARYPGADELVEALAPHGADGRFGGGHAAPPARGGSHFGSHHGTEFSSRHGGPAGSSQPMRFGGGPAAPPPAPPARPNPASAKVPTPQNGPLTPPPPPAAPRPAPRAPAAPPPAASKPGGAPIPPSRPSVAPLPPSRAGAAPVPPSRPGIPAVPPSKHGSPQSKATAAPVPPSKHGGAAVPPSRAGLPAAQPAAGKPAPPSRAGGRALPVATPVAAGPADDDLPVALPLEAFADQPKKGPFSTLFILMLAAFISMAVYIFGKNYLFAN